MNDQTLRRVIGVMGTALVVVVGAIVVLLLVRGGPGGPSPSPSIAVVSPSPSASPSASASPSPTPSPSPSPTPSPTASPSPTPTPIPTATLTFVGLKLASSGSADSLQRIITFTSDGPGTIKAALATPTGDKIPTHMCLRAGTKELGCKDWTEGTFSGKTTQAHTNWRVTLIGTNTVESPVVDLTVTFQAVAPKVRIVHARFDGTEGEPALNGIQVRFVPRADGDVGLVASWGGHAFIYHVQTFDDTTGSGGADYPNQGPATNVNLTSPVTATDTWRLVLENSEGGFGATDLTATISWP
jgi:hypothetical protein